MKLKILSLLALTVFLSLVISSYKEGPDHYAGYDCTGAAGTNSLAQTGCSGSIGGQSCHGSTTSNHVVIELDSANVPVKQYFPGMRYTIKISGRNGTSHNLGFFGFQMASVMLAGSGDSANSMQAGTWDSLAIPLGVQYEGAGFCCPTSAYWNHAIIEHSHALGIVGSGGTGAAYADSVLWTAPATHTGTIVLYGALNAADGDGTQAGDYAQAAAPDTIREAYPTGINEILGNIPGLKIYPTLMNNQLTVAFLQSKESAVSLSLVNINGQEVLSLMNAQAVGSGEFSRSFDVNGLAQGVYLVKIQVGGSMAVSKVVKQ